MKLNDKIKKALIAMSFSERYLELSNKYYFDTNTIFRNYDNKVVLDILKDFKYNVKYFKSENFFQIKEIYENCPYEFGFNISVKYGVAELIWVVRENGILIEGGPWMVLNRLLNEEKKKTIRFRNYDDLREILKTAFEMYEDFKKEVMKL